MPLCKLKTCYFISDIESLMVESVSLALRENLLYRGDANPFLVRGLEDRAFWMIVYLNKVRMDTP